MHTLNDMSHEEMGLTQHYEDHHSDYGLDVPANQATFIEHEFYPSHQGIPVQDTKYQPPFVNGKTLLPRGLRFYGSWIEGMLSPIPDPLFLSSRCLRTPSSPPVHQKLLFFMLSNDILCPLLYSTGRYQVHEMNGSVDSYSPQQYEQSFQTVPASVPPTPSPDQWSSELSPHSNNSSNGTVSSSASSAHVPPPPAHHPHSHPHPHHPYPGLPHHAAGRDLHSLPMLSPIPGQMVSGHHHLLTHGGDGKPVIQAAVLAGQSEPHLCVYGVPNFLIIVNR